MVRRMPASISLPWRPAGCCQTLIVANVVAFRQDLSDRVTGYPTTADCFVRADRIARIRPPGGCTTSRIVTARCRAQAFGKVCEGTYGRSRRACIPPPPDTEEQFPGRSPGNRLDASLLGAVLLHVRVLPAEEWRGIVRETLASVGSLRVAALHQIRWRSRSRQSWGLRQHGTRVAPTRLRKVGPLWWSSMRRPNMPTLERSGPTIL